MHVLSYHLVHEMDCLSHVMLEFAERARVTKLAVDSYMSFI